MLHRPGRLFAVATLLATVAGTAHAEPPSAREALSGILSSQLIEHVKLLSSDALEGRAAGSKGAYTAGDYIAAKFKAWGLQPVGTPASYFQTLPMGAATGLGKNNRFAFHGEIGDRTADGALSKGVGTLWTPFPWSANAAAKGSLVFAGYGITAPEHEYDDYAGVDVKGKVVVIIRHEPRADQAGDAFEGKRHTRHAWFQTKVDRAQKAGAAALIIVNNPKLTPKGDPLYGTRGGGVGGCKIPVMHVKQATVRMLLKAGGADLDALQKQIDESLKPASAALPVTVDVACELTRKTITARNVLGFKPGSDPKLKDEIVVVGAHYDHLGYGAYGSLGGARARNQIHNGADDNASGTAGMLELARAFSQLPTRRSILFMGFTGEERGLIGSQYYVDHPIFPLARTVAMLNLDMIGRGKTGEFSVNGIGSSPVWPPLVEALKQRLGGQISFGQSGYAPSDNTSFFRKKIPVLFFFTGMHADYHRPSDDWDKVNQPQIELVTRWAFMVTQYVTNVIDERPAYRDTGRGGGMGRRSGPYLGVTAGPESAKGFVVGRVQPGTAAAKGGLAAGDVVIQFGTHKIGGMRDLVRAIRRYKVGDQVEVKVLRGDGEQTLKVTLQGR